MTVIIQGATSDLMLSLVNEHTFFSLNGRAFRIFWFLRGVIPPV